MVGTHVTTMGGVSTVVRGYMDGGLLQRFDARYVATHRDGSHLVKFFAAVKAYLKVSVLLLTMKSPLLHIHLSSRASFWRKFGICLLAMLTRRPYLLHVHGSEFMKFYRQESGPRAQRLVRFAFRHAVLVLALSNEWRANILEICPGARVEVLPNAVPLPPAREGAGSATEIVFLGRLGERKGTFDLVRAFAKVFQDFPHASLTCAGDGVIDEIVQLTRQLHVDDRVRCPGWLNAEQAHKLLSTAGIFVLPSYAEGLPMSLLEAMSWGLPVVSSPVGGIPQVVRHQENGLLVEPGDVDNLAASLASLLGDKDQRSRLGEAARETIENHFSLQAAIEKLSGIYASFGVPQRA